MEFPVVYFRGPRPGIAAKAQKAILRVSDTGITLGDMSMPYYAMASCTVQAMDGIGTVVRIESEFEPLTMMVPRCVLFGRLVIINMYRTTQMGQAIDRALQLFKQLEAVVNSPKA